MQKSNDENLVSIVVPVYNIKDYLPRCINSILAQSYGLFELLLVDDGSNDGSGDLCDSYSKTDKRIRVIHQDNAGLSAARNKGIDESEGSYIAFIDGDDFVHPQMIDILLKEMKTNNTDIAVCGLIKTYENETSFKNISNYNSECLYGEEVLKKYFNNDSHYDLNVACNKIYKKYLFNSIKYPAGMLHEDNATTYKILYKAKSVSIIYEDLYFYFQRRESISHKNLNDKRIEDLIAGYNERIYFFDNLGKYQFETRKQVLQLIVSILEENNEVKKNVKKDLIIFGKKIFKEINIFKLSIKETIYFICCLYFYKIFLAYISFLRSNIR